MQYLYVYFILAVATANFVSASDPETCRVCKLHQVCNECASLCLEEATCGSRNPPVDPGPCPDVCVERCECDKKAGYIRESKDGKCIKVTNCPGECKANEVFNDCASCVPEPTCQNRNPEQIPCEKRCFPRCECNAKEGYIRDENTGKCVKNKNCPRCGFKEIEGCKPCCPERTCQYPQVIPCTRLCPLICKFACLCIEGYLRDEVSGKCIPEKICWN